MNNYHIIIPQRLKGERVDFALSQMFPKLSRNKITSIIKNGSTTILGNNFKPKDKISGGEIVEFSYQESSSTHWESSCIDIDIVFEDEDILVINKPAGLITHPGSGNPINTLANALLYHYPELKNVDRAGIVHRLDKDTSGLLVVAKNYESQQNLINQLKIRSVKREYNAICYGHIIAGSTVDEPIGRDGKNRLKQAVNESGKEAITHFRVIDKFNDFTLVKVMLETGRTHQIRVHMTHIGYPLVGDMVYGKGLRLPKGASEILKNALKNFKRQALHAKKLSFIHPKIGETMSFKTPIPEDMQHLIKVFQEENV